MIEPSIDSAYSLSLDIVGIVMGIMRVDRIFGLILIMSHLFNP